MYVDSSMLTAESLARAAVIVGVCALLLFSSLTSIIVILFNVNLHDAVSSYMMSLFIADLMLAVFVVPLSAYSALSPDWHFLGDNSWLCKGSTYLQLVIIISTLFTFGWLSVDRFSAFMRPSRYESEHTQTRCKCWLAFTWLTAILGALPVLFNQSETNYYHEYEFCVLNWNSATAYSATIAVLVFVPSFCTIVFTSAAIFLALRKPEELEDVQRTAIETDQNFIVTMFVIIAYIIGWAPIVVVHFLPVSLLHPADTATMKFAFIWFTHSEFRRFVCSPCVGRPRDTPINAHFDSTIAVANNTKRAPPVVAASTSNRRSGGGVEPSARSLAAFPSDASRIEAAFRQSQSYYNNAGLEPHLLYPPARSAPPPNYGAIGSSQREHR